MKRIESVMVTGSTGPVPADTYDRWTKKVEGLTFEFALHADPSPGQPLLRDLCISELSTGFDTGAVLMHPVHKVRLTEAAMNSLTDRQLKQFARSALHNHLCKVGWPNFVEAVLKGQIQLAKLNDPAPAEPGPIAIPHSALLKGKKWDVGRFPEDQEKVLRALRSDS